ncbi:NAD(P)H-hydrate dehydratase [Larsenimonas suaedae]|uniref:Bifunctional NAD(P)H-hydrate repair enzyme n=1 Tax=Larsenimonas suaedae TaxID=1851019 RepID=A0ABU1GY30_9GAMM|nr:NAD(P)H-hydrate dehydratase [Larsenimonas suaedae]MCM2972860.1 NAD(P)H-hydrate dehydratase [Larsenimonas suaedae]MDR5896959.1 NAD(P)H-hydrate dehydratase [Larsenimonas suaedae]
MERAIRLYSAEQSRALDQKAMEHGPSGFDLMQRAGHAAFNLIRKRWPEAGSLSILCGGGNNGGDGFVVAALARQSGLRVQCVALKPESALSGEALEAWQLASAAGVVMTPWSPDVALDGALIVDALLGTGIAGTLRTPFDAAIERINGAGVPVLSLDVPSGVNADTGQVVDVAIVASLTVTFIGRKLGLYTGDAVDHVGECVFAGLEVGQYLNGVDYQATLLSRDRLSQRLPARKPSTHKGQCGHALVIGGQPGYGGASIMVAEAAARLGAGLVSLATDEVHVAPALTRRPELMVRPTRNAHDIHDLLEACDVIAIGPGLGRGAWGEGLMAAALASNRPAVIDADGLHVMQALNLMPTAPHVLTPHPGEAAALLGWSIADIQADRLAAVRALKARFGGTVLLKGAGTLIAGTCPMTGDEVVYLNAFGNPGMATGGMGDTLTGFITALLAQGLSPLEAALNGSLLHALAADEAARDDGERGVLATDLASYARRLANPQ